MKKLIFVLAIAFAGVFTACGPKAETTDTLGAAADTTEVVTDTLATDTVVADTVVEVVEEAVAE